MTETKVQNAAPRIIIGIFLFALGILFLLSNLDMLDPSIPRFLFSWEVILIIIGVFILIKSNDVAGYILITIGSIFLISHHYNFNAWDFWPVILIIVGFYVLMNRNKTMCVKGSHSNKKRVSDDFIDEVAVFGGGKRIITSKNFQGGKVTAIFGGSEIDLYEAKLAPGENVIDITAMFGGASFFVPKDWKVIINVTPIFGGFADERRRDPNTVYNEENTLVLKGLVLFGGGEIKSA